MAFLIAWRAIWLPGIVVCGSFCSAEQQRRWVSESAANGRDFSCRDRARARIPWASAMRTLRERLRKPQMICERAPLMVASQRIVALWSQRGLGIVAVGDRIGRKILS